MLEIEFFKNLKIIQKESLQIESVNSIVLSNFKKMWKNISFNDDFDYVKKCINKILSSTQEGQEFFSLAIYLSLKSLKKHESNHIERHKKALNYVLDLPIYHSNELLMHFFYYKDVGLIEKIIKKQYFVIDSALIIFYLKDDRLRDIMVKYLNEAIFSHYQEVAGFLLFFKEFDLFCSLKERFLLSSKQLDDFLTDEEGSFYSSSNIPDDNVSDIIKFLLTNEKLNDNSIINKEWNFIQAMDLFERIKDVKTEQEYWSILLNDRKKVLKFLKSININEEENLRLWHLHKNEILEAIYNIKITKTDYVDTFFIEEIKKYKNLKKLELL